MGLRRRGRSEHGQASVELVAALPFVLALGAVLWQCALAGHAAWVVAHAARAGARAQLVGADVERAVRSTLPAGLERDLDVDVAGGRVRVRVAVPLLVHRWRLPIAVGATASLEAGR